MKRVEAAAFRRTVGRWRSAPRLINHSVHHQKSLLSFDKRLFWCRTEWSTRRGAERQRSTVRRKAAACRGSRRETAVITPERRQPAEGPEGKRQSSHLKGGSLPRLPKGNGSLHPFQYIDYNFTLFLNGVFGFAEYICVFGAKIENTALFVLYNNVYIFETWA